MTTLLQRTEAFIRAVEIRILNQNNPLLDANGNLVNDFKVLYGRVWADNNVLRLQSIHPSSTGMQISFPVDKVCYSHQNLNRNTANFHSNQPIFIAILNENYFDEAEKHNLIKTLGHPTQYLNLIGNRGIPNPNQNLIPTFLEIFSQNDNKLQTYFH